MGQMYFCIQNISYFYQNDQFNWAKIYFALLFLNINELVGFYLYFYTDILFPNTPGTNAISKMLSS